MCDAEEDELDELLATKYKRVDTEQACVTSCEWEILVILFSLSLQPCTELTDVDYSFSTSFPQVYPASLLK